MSEAVVPADPLLSPAFDKARRLSRILATLFGIGFFVTLLWLLTIPWLVAFPELGGIRLGTPLPLRDLDLSTRAGVYAVILLTAQVPLRALLRARQVFLLFAADRVFDTATIDRIRATGFWLIFVPFASIAEEVLVNVLIPSHPAEVDVAPELFFVGIGMYVAAYVMAEARRIADDNASIV